MRLSTYRLTKSTILTIEREGRDPLTFTAPKGTEFLGKWIPSTATKGMGDLALEGGYCIPLCPKPLFEKV